MNEDNYRSISDLTTALAAFSAKLDSGSLAPEELVKMLEDARELSERLVVLRYKAFENQVRTTEVPEKEEEPKRNAFRIGRSKDKAAKKKEKPNQGGLQLDFHSQAEETAKEEIIPRNQVNMMDLIQEEERQRNDDDLVPEIESVETPADPAEPEAAKPEQEVQTEPVVEKQVEVPVEEKVEKPVEEVPDVELPPIPESSKTKEEAPSTLLDQLGNENTQSLADRLGKSPIADLKKAIGINQKFLFMNDLFEGENSHYHDAVGRLNEFAGYDGAKGLLNELQTRFSWDPESQSTIAFTELVERRYL